MKILFKFIQLKGIMGKMVKILIMNNLKTILIVSVWIFNSHIILGQIPKIGTFSQKIAFKDSSDKPNPFLTALGESQFFVFYNDNMIVTLQSSIYAEQDYNYINKNNGNCTIIDKENGVYVETNTKDFNRAFDILDLWSTTDTISFDTTDFKFLGTSCQKVTKTFDTTKSTYFIINNNISYFSVADGKQIHFPLEENISLGEYSQFKTIDKVDSTFDHNIFIKDLSNLKKNRLINLCQSKNGFSSHSRFYIQ